MRNTIRNIALACAGLAAIGFGATGCDNTAKGVKEDSEELSQKAAEGAGQAKESASQTSADVLAATELTPRIKAAIVSNPALNDPANQIDVDADDNAVYLRGHVSSDKLRRSAEELARQVLKESSAKQTLHNDLKVSN